MTSSADGEHGEVVLGIDLGTSNISACVLVDGTPQIIPLEDPSLRGGLRETSLPSVVAFEGAGTVTVGTLAVAHLADAPATTVFGAKRFVGRQFDSLQVQRMLPLFPYHVVPGRDGRAAVQLPQGLVSLVNVAARLLKAVRASAQDHLGRSIEHAVITVPAYYNDNQRQAVVRAARLAGLTVDSILGEPTAAAVAYGMTSSRPRTILVFDLGGGTFDVSIMRVGGKDLRVLAVGGDTFLGGADFDDAIVELVRGAYFLETKSSLSKSRDATAALRQAAERAKVRLSLRSETTLAIRSIALVGGATERLEVPLGRDDVEQAVSPLIDRALKICELVMSEARVLNKDIDDVILVGGQTRMPIVQQRVEKFFGRAGRQDLNPDEVVAIGAAIFPHISGKGGTAFTDVLPMSIGMGHAGVFKPLLKKNTPLPCRVEIPFRVRRADYETFQIELWQGDSDRLANNEKLGTVCLDVVEPGPQDPVSMKVVIEVAADSFLRIGVQNVSTGASQRCLLRAKEVQVDVLAG